MANGQQQGEKTKSRLELLEETVLEVIDKLGTIEKEIEALKKTTIRKSSGLFGGKRERTAIKDIKTGKVYISKSAVGKALATEADSTAEDHFAWYKLQAKFPDRFIEASAAEKAQVEKEEEERMAKAVEEENKRLAAEEAAEAAKAKKAK